jgi:hypothetical protein
MCEKARAGQKRDRNRKRKEEREKREPSNLRETYSLPVFGCSL